MRPLPVTLDFAAGPPRATLLGGLILCVGICAVVVASLEYHSVKAKRAGLELRLAAAQQRTSRIPADVARAAKFSEESTAIARELGTPWTAVLADLEGASVAEAHEVAVLSVEPDHEKHRVRISGEARTLPEVLGYLHRLQASRSLRYPMLDSHETVAEDKEHPVRFSMSADWRELP
jgi:hypothetical protein